MLLINSSFTSNVGVITFNDFVTDVVGSLEYCSAVASTVGATGKPQCFNAMFVLLAKYVQTHTNKHCQLKQNIMTILSHPVTKISNSVT